MELLDIVDLNGNPTSEVIEREFAHSNGVMHRTSHVWLFRKHNSDIEILLQKRADDKDSFPGCYDISSAGHIPAGDDFITSAIRELYEELGISVDSSDLIHCGDIYFTFDDVFYGREFHDRQYSRVFVLWYDIDENDIEYQKEEISCVKWFKFSQLLADIENNAIKHCIFNEELELLSKFVLGA